MKHPYTARHFYEPVLQILGRLTRYRAEVFVPRAEVIPLVLSEIGLTPLRMTPQMRSNGPNGLPKRVGWGFRNQREEHKKNTNRPAMTVQGPKSGLWGLTDAGVAEAKRLDGVREKNATSRWLDANYCKIQPVLAAAILRKLPVSASAGLTEDHVNNYIVRMIERDALAERIQAGLTITASHVATYAVRSAYTDIRGMATDPVTRIMLGARTEQERKRSKDEALMTASPNVMPSQIAYVNNNSTDTFDLEFVDTSFTDGQTRREAFEALWGRVEKVLRRRKPETWGVYQKVLSHRLEGCTIVEVATREQVSERQAASMIIEIGDAFREVKNQGAFDGLAP